MAASTEEAQRFGMERSKGDAVTAIIVAHQSAHVLPACLAALRQEDVPVIVVDNASTDGSAELAARFGASVMRNGRNEGFGRAMNAGVAAAATPLCLLTNPDLVYGAGALAALRAAAARYPGAGMLAPRIIEADGRFFWQTRSLLSPAGGAAGGSHALPEGDCCAPFLSGASLLVRRDIFMALKGFDPAIFLFFEDDDLCRRMIDAGHGLVHVHEAIARHGRGQSSAPGPGRIFRARWHLAWSRAYVSRKWGLRDPALGLMLQNAPKALGAMLIGRNDLAERYGGSAAGAMAWLRGMTALEREGLN